MNFYIGNQIKEININDENVEISDSIIERIYNCRNLIETDIKSFLNINPYKDCEVCIENTKNIIAMFEYILNEDCVNKLFEQNELDDIRLCVKLAKKALSLNIGLVSIGD